MTKLKPACQPDLRCSLFASIFANSKDAILVVDQELMIVEANPAAASLTGQPNNKLTENTSLIEIFPDPSTVNKLNDLVFSTENSFELYLKPLGGEIFPVSVTSSPLPDPYACVLVLRDISERHRKEQEQLTNYIIQAQEAERKRLARDLHDGIGQALFSILVGLKVLSQAQLPLATYNHLLDVQNMASRALEEVKIMAVELRPAALDDLGLIPAIRSYLKRFEQTFGIEPQLEVIGGQRRFCSTVETALYRICQEALTNVAKYSDSSRVLIKILNHSGGVELSVQDFGRGFELASISQTGLGIFGMRERANLLGGELTIASGPNRGTLIKASIPLNDKGDPIHAHYGAYCG